MIKASNDISILIVIVRTYRKVLSPIVHVISECQLALIINYVAFLTGNGHIPLLASDEQEFVIWYVECLEIPGEIMLRELILVDEFEFFEIVDALHVVEKLQGVRVEGHQGHREVRVVRDLTQVVYQL